MLRHPEAPGGFPEGHGAVTERSGAARLKAALLAHGAGSHCHPVMNGAAARRSPLFVLEVSVTLKGILHAPNRGVGADVTGVVSAPGAPGSSHCPEWEQSSFEDLTHKLSDTPHASPLPLSASSPLML